MQGVYFLKRGVFPRRTAPLLTRSRTGKATLTLCVHFLSGNKSLYSPFFFWRKNLFFHFISPQNSSRDQNFAVAGGKQILTITRMIPSYGSPNPTRRQVQKFPLRRENRTIAHHCCHSAISAKTLLLPPKPPQNTFCTEGCGVREAGRVQPGATGHFKDRWSRFRHQPKKTSNLSNI